MYRWPLDRYDVCAGVIIMLGTLLRFILIAQGWPAAYNDEGTIGLMARHVAYQGAHPLVYYGQDYMGSLEAYLGAAFFQLFGPSTFALRLGLILIFALFLICMYLLTSLLYSKGLAVITLILLSLGSSEVMLRELMAAAGPPEYSFFTTLLLLLTVWLALTSSPRVPLAGILAGGGVGWRRLIAYGAWGAVAGLDVWSHLLCLPFVLCAGLVLVLFCRRELRLPTLSVLGLCLLLGVSPLLIYKATVPVSPYQTSLFSGMFGGGYHEPTYPPPRVASVHVNMEASTAPKPPPLLPVQQVEGTVLVAIPVATNGSMLCPLSANDIWPLSDQASAYTRLCTAVHGAWGLGFVVLWAVAAIAAARRFWTLWRSQSAQAEDAEQRRETIRQAARLMILTGAGLTLLAFALSPQSAAVTPWTSARYLVGLLIAFPAVLHILVSRLENTHVGARYFLSDRLSDLHRSPNAAASCLTDRLSGLHRSPNAAARSDSFVADLDKNSESLVAGRNKRQIAPLVPLLSAALLLLVFAASLLGSIDVFRVQVHGAQESYLRQQGLIHGLLQLGATHVYTDYEDCDRLAFLSNERVICAVLDKGLQPGLDRYFPYRAMVETWPNPAYVFLDGSAQQVLFEQEAAEQHVAYVKLNIAGYLVYQPEQRIAL